MSCDITLEDLNELLSNSSQKQYKATVNDATISKTIKTCSALLQLDYSVAEISNENAELSTNYPSHILVPECEKPRCGSAAVIYEQQAFDAVKFRDLIKAARLARCRARFPIPVIFYRGKYVCRSATLSGGAEIYTRSSFDYLYGSAYGFKMNEDIDNEEGEEVGESYLADNNVSENKSNKFTDWVYINQVRQQDKKLIKYVNVGTIVDFMVENKKVKYGFNVTSSEKIDKEKRYAEFNIISLPYPGCEFFKLFKENGNNGENLKFNWQQNYVDAKIFVPDDQLTAPLQIDWEQYENWDINVMTQNYMKLLLKYLRDNSHGMLVHCISGWDRTPLFISLLRMLLWADGAIHNSLSTNQILYFTLAYDWYLFGHNLPDRLAKGEDILFYCFYVLKYFVSKEYCTTTNPRVPKNSVSSSSSSSVCVLRTDSGGDVENFLSEVESTGSNLSLNSFESGRSHNDSCQSDVFNESSNGNGFLINQDSNGSLSGMENQNGNTTSMTPLARTSPVSVPIPASRTRQRNESFSSINNSWHVISATGSLRNPEPHIDLMKQNANTNSQESSTTTVTNDDAVSVSSSSHERITSRSERLNDIRNTFYKVYYKAINVTLPRDEPLQIGQFINNLAERAGLTKSQ